MGETFKYVTLACALFAAIPSKADEAEASALEADPVSDDCILDYLQLDPEMIPFKFNPLADYAVKTLKKIKLRLQSQAFVRTARLGIRNSQKSYPVFNAAKGRYVRKTPLQIMQSHFSSQPFTDLNGTLVYIPIGMKYLAMVESNLDPYAVGSLQEKGIWQFREKTAELCGKLHVRDRGETYNPLYDERIDIDSSTKGFVECAGWLWNIFHSWDLVVASWNAGNTVMCRLFKFVGHRDAGCREKDVDEIDEWNHIDEVWDIVIRKPNGDVTAHFPPITKQYVSSFFATAFMYNYLQNPAMCGS